MLQRLAVFLALLAVLTPAAAQEPDEGKTRFTVTFLTDPPGARVMGNTSFLGLSGEPITLEVPQDRQRVVVTFELEGYHPNKQSIPLYELQSSPTYPQSGPIVLSATSGMVLAKRFVKNHAWLLGVTTLLLIPAGVLYRKRQSGLYDQVDRAAKLETLQAKATTEDDLIMTTLGNWRLVDLIGLGGMAAVYRGLPEATLKEEEAVAVKVLNREVTRNPEFRARFEREILLYRTLNHPHIVQLIDWGEQDGLTYLVLELVDGVPLDELIPENGFPRRRALELLEPLVDAVSYAHSRDVIHRDLKPENVMITPNSMVKLMDFGLARQVGSGTITQEGHFMGTPAFVSPEQVTGKFKVGPPSDQYSLGCIAYNMLCGRVPFESDDPQQQVFQQAFEPPPPLTDFNKDLPEAVDAVMLKILDKDPNNRYENVEEAYWALRDALKL